MEGPVSLTDGPVGGTLARLVRPILYANVLLSLNGSINSIWVGHYLGEAALTATANAGAVVTMLIGAGFSIGAAATILIGQHIGANDVREAKRVVGTGATFFVALSLVVAVVGWMRSWQILDALGTPLASRRLADAYIRVMLLAMPFTYLYVFITSVLQSAGDSRTPFKVSLLSVALDIVLNPLFIFGAGPVPRLGVAGSALATLVSQCAALAALLFRLYARGHVLCPRRHELVLLKLDWSLTWSFVLLGVPMSAQTLVGSLGNMLMIPLVNRLGVETAAAFGAAGQLWAYVLIPMVAVTSGVSAMAAQNIGARKWDRVRSVARVGVVQGVLLTGCSVLLMEVLDRHAFALFLPPGSQALEIASHASHIVGWSFILLAVFSVYFAVTRASGAAVVPLFILAVGILLVRVSFASSLLKAWQGDAIWWSYPVSGLVITVLVLAYYRYGNWEAAAAQLRPDNASRCREV